MKRKSSNILIFIFVFIYSNIALAEFKWFELSLGVGLSVAENNRLRNTAEYFQGTYSVEPRPFAFFRVGPIAFSSEGAGVALIYLDNFKILGTFFYDGEPYNADGLTYERGRSIFAGGVIHLYHLVLMGFQDVEEKSNGRIFKVTSKPEFQVVDNWTFSPRMYVQFWDDKYVDYYYGVGAEEVDTSIGRTSYVGRAAVNYGFDLRNVFKSGHLKYLFEVGIKYFGRTVADSPTVTDDKEVRANFGIILDLF